MDPQRAGREAQNDGGRRAEPGGIAGNANIPGGIPNIRGAPRLPADRNTTDVLLTQLARMNLDTESDVINRPDRPGTETQAPSFLLKVRLFVSLLFLTLHPAVWDKRRSALREREGQLKTERNARETPASAGDEDTPENKRATEARAAALRRHAHRPPWAQEYVARVGRSEWEEE